jgi:site-specific recombinase XerC
VPDALTSLRDSFALHLDATRKPKTTRIYLAALDGLIAHLEMNGMPTATRSVRREHVESHIAARRETVKPTTLSIEFRALQQSFRWALEEDEIERSPMERMKAPTVPRSPVPVVAVADFRKLLKTAEGNAYNARRDTAILMTFLDSRMRLGELTGLKVGDVDVRGRLAYVTGKADHVRAVKSARRRPWRSTATRPPRPTSEHASTTRARWTGYERQAPHRLRLRAGRGRNPEPCSRPHYRPRRS